MELQTQKHGFELQLEKVNTTVELLKMDCKRKDSEKAAVINEKDIILRNKINEFRQSEYIDKLRELQDIIRIKDLEIKDLYVNLQLT